MKVMLLTTPNNLIQREKFMVDVVIKMKISINKYSQVFNRVVSGYGEMTKFIIIDQRGSSPREGYNFSFSDAEFHTVSNASTLCRVNVGL
jgi:hypothetical protein